MGQAKLCRRRPGEVLVDGLDFVPLFHAIDGADVAPEKGKGARSPFTAWPAFATPPARRGSRPRRVERMLMIMAMAVINPKAGCQRQPACQQAADRNEKSCPATCKEVHAYAWLPGSRADDGLAFFDAFENLDAILSLHANAHVGARRCTSPSCTTAKRRPLVRIAPAGSQNARRLLDFGSAGHKCTGRPVHSRPPLPIPR